MSDRQKRTDTRNRSCADHVSEKTAKRGINPLLRSKRACLWVFCGGSAWRQHRPSPCVQGRKNSGSDSQHVLTRPRPHCGPKPMAIALIHTNETAFCNLTWTAAARFEARSQSVREISQRRQSSNVWACARLRRHEMQPDLQLKATLVDIDDGGAYRRDRRTKRGARCW